MGHFVCLILFCFLSWSLTACDGTNKQSSRSFHSVDITGADYGRGLALPDIAGQIRTIADFKGQLVLLFFGYTQCPDVCPTTLTEIASLRQTLSPNGEQLIRTVFVTLDPVHDTPELLSAYLANFGGDIIALRGTEEQTELAAKSFKVYYKNSPGETSGTYTIDHTAGIYIFDKNGQLRLFSRYGMSIDKLQEDILKLIR